MNDISNPRSRYRLTLSRKITNSGLWERTNGQTTHPCPTVSVFYLGFFSEARSSSEMALLMMACL